MSRLLAVEKNSILGVVLMNLIKLLAVDDEGLNLELVKEFCKTLDFDIVLFNNPINAINYLENNEVDIVLVDYYMPDMDGVEFIKQTKIMKPEAFVIMITGSVYNDEVKLVALESGAAEFLNKPIIKAEFIARLKNVKEIIISRKIVAERALSLDVEVKKATENIRKREYETLCVLGRAAEFKDPETAYHVQRVAHYSRLILSKLSNSVYSQDLIFSAAPLHDIGKIGISDAILLKPGKLSVVEFDIIKTHPEIGAQILASSDSDFLKKGLEIALTHHEKFDGSGYPKGLKGEEIPLFGRIVAIADVFDALTSVRPYKAAWSIEEGFEYIQNESGKHFDPKIVKIFMELRESIIEIKEAFKEDGKSNYCIK